ELGRSVRLLRSRNLVCGAERVGVKLAGASPAGELSLNDSSCALGHNTLFPLRRSPPGSFKRMLGSRVRVLWPCASHENANKPEQAPGEGGVEGNCKPAI